MMDDKKIDQGLDDFFAAARETEITPSDVLLARIIGDAADHLPHAQITRAATPTGIVTKILDALGGWPSVAGLASASIVGLWVGYVQPGIVEDFTDVLISSDAESYLFDINPSSSLF